MSASRIVFPINGEPPSTGNCPISISSCEDVPFPFLSTFFLLHGCPEAFQLPVRTYDRNLVIWIEMLFPLWYIQAFFLHG